MPRRFYRRNTRWGGFAGRYSGLNYSGLGGRMSYPENKFHDIDIDDATISAAGTIQIDSIHKIAAGTGESTRLARQVHVKAILWRGVLTVPSSTSLTQSWEQFRIIVYLDHQANGATATPTSILESDNIDSFKNLANTGRFTVLWDRMFMVEAKAGAWDGTNDLQFGGHRMFHFYKKCNIPILFNSVTGAITEICCNNIGILTLCRTGGFATMNSKLRVRFQDD